MGMCTLYSRCLLWRIKNWLYGRVDGLRMRVFVWICWCTRVSLSLSFTHSVCVSIVYISSTCKWYHSNEINYGNTQWNVDNEHECTYAIHLLFTSYSDSAFHFDFFFLSLSHLGAFVMLASHLFVVIVVGVVDGGKIQMSVMRTKSLRPYRVTLKFLCKCPIWCSFFICQIPFYV